MLGPPSHRTMRRLGIAAAAFGGVEVAFAVVTGVVTGDLGRWLWAIGQGVFLLAMGIPIVRQHGPADSGEPRA